MLVITGFKLYQDDTERSFSDGAWIARSSRSFARRSVLCRATASLKVRHFFYGGAPGVPEQLASRLTAAFPGLQVGGLYSPPYRPLSETELAQVVGVMRRDNGSGV